MTIQSCMGGFKCARRDHCANYHAASVDQQPAERLCPPGQDGAGLTAVYMEPINMRHYLSPEKRESIVAMLTEAGMPVRRITEAVGCCASNARTEVARLADAGRIFTTRARTDEAPRSEVWAFPTREARDRFRAERDAAMAQRVRDYQRAQSEARKAARHAEGRFRGARSVAAEQREMRRHEERLRERAMRAAEAEMCKERKRLTREAAAAERQRIKAEAKSQQKALKAMTKAAGSLIFKSGTASPAPTKARGPAMAAGEPDISRARITIAPTPRGRYDVDSVPSVIDSRECRAWAQAAAA